MNVVNAVLWRFPRLLHEVVFRVTGYRQVAVTCLECQQPTCFYWTRVYPCGYGCEHVEPYGFVPEAGCPVHDR